MVHYSDDHERILTLVFEERWLGFNSEDNDLLKSFVYTGHIHARPVQGHPGRYRLSLTERGSLYLSYLRREPRLVPVEPAPASLIPIRRSSDPHVERRHP